MRVFQQVVEEGGFSAAARKLDLAPTAVTRLVSDLEAHLGVRLLQRTTRHLSLTRAGEVYLARLQSILSELGDAEIQVRDESHRIGGELRVLAPSVAASHMLAAAAAGFLALHPGVAIDIDVVESSDPPVHEYDLALVGDDCHMDPDFICHALVHSEYVLCAAPAYLDRFGEPGEPQALAQHRLLRLRRGARRPGPLELYRPEAPHERVRLVAAAAIVSNDLDSLLRATLAGAGISCQPVHLIAPLALAGRLRRVLDGWIAGHLTLMAVLASRKFIPLRTRAFVDYLVAHSGRFVDCLGTQWDGPRLPDVRPAAH
ncbi:LysR family transcriptional regulator [Ramlibacter rhizophilus]|nr:LysR family transcriptional regulator [Ramlibacter rhizophilus]